MEFASIQWKLIDMHPLSSNAINRIMRLRGYGNGIVAQQAAAFIESVMECLA